MEKENAEDGQIQEKVKNFFSESHSEEHVCPIKDILDRFADKWSIYTILTIGQDEKIRFNELKARVSGISQRMLTVTLRTLEQDGLVERTVFSEIPPRVEYRLTALGKSLLEQIFNLADWASHNMDEIIRSRKKFAGKDYIS